MGAKYLPTTKDLKATQRYHQKLSARPKFKTVPPAASAKSGRKK